LAAKTAKNSTTAARVRHKRRLVAEVGFCREQSKEACLVDFSPSTLPLKACF